jgi:hypothetical protein
VDPPDTPVAFSDLPGEIRICLNVGGETLQIREGSGNQALPGLNRAGQVADGLGEFKNSVGQLPQFLESPFGYNALAIGQVKTAGS